VEHALGKLDLMVAMDIFMNETTALADVILPSASWPEKDGTFTNTERKVQRVRKAVTAPGLALPDWKILEMLANKMGASWNYADANAIMEEIRSVTPSYKGISYQRLENEGLQWPCPNEEHPGTRILHSAAFTRGKGLFTVNHYMPPAEVTDKEYPFILTTGRILQQYHTATMTRRSKGLVSMTPDAFVEINPVDAKELGIAAGDKIVISSRRGKITVNADVTSSVDKGVVFVPFHYHEAAVNRLTNTAIDPIANIPEYKVCAVSLRKAL
jgi:formate dehydrogenase major subunit/formate dehydrogenase alpha subunit